MKKLTIDLLRLFALSTFLIILMTRCSRKDQDFRRESVSTPLPTVEAFGKLDNRIQKIVRAIESKPAIKTDFSFLVQDKGEVVWGKSLISLRNNTLVALMPLKKKGETSFEAFLAVELDTTLRFKIFDASQLTTYSTNELTGGPSAFEINHALNALNHLGFGRQAYVTKGLPQGELKRLEQYKRGRKSGSLQQMRSSSVITITTCYSWSACMGDGNGNCVGEIYYFTECVSETIWFKSYDDSYDMGGGYGYDPRENAYYDPNIPTSAEDLKNVQVTPPLIPVVDPNEYLACFDTSLPAKVIIYADQPVSGTTEPISILGGIGHAYLSFEQTVNGTMIRRTLGFYNQTKVDPFFNKSAPGMLGNDSTHEYNVKWETSLSPEQFDGMIQATKNHAPEYNIENYNCANFVLDVAAAGGIQLPRTTGWWYVGSGLNPGALGEDLRKQPGATSGRGYTKDNIGTCQ